MAKGTLAQERSVITFTVLSDVKNLSSGRTTLYIIGYEENGKSYDNQI